MGGQMVKSKNRTIFNIVSLLITLMLLFSSSALSQTIYLRDGDHSQDSNFSSEVFIQNDEDDVPVWTIGDYWEYKVNFNACYNDPDFGKIIELKNAVINNFKVKVIEICNNEYIVDLSGQFSSKLSLLNIFSNFGTFSGDIEGEGKLSQDSFAMSSFYMKADGQLKLLGLIPLLLGYLEIDVDLSERPLDFLDLPINVSEDVDNPWEIDSIAEATGYAGFWVPIGNNFRGGWNLDMSGRFFADCYHVIEKKPHTVEAGEYDCYKIQGCVGPSNGGKSYMWYSPDAGFMVEIQEEFSDFVGISGSLTLELTDTNYRSANNPPYEPSNPLPLDQSTGQEINNELSWDGGDPDSDDELEYKVYFGTNSNPPLLDTTTNTYFDLDLLDYEQTYYWKIVACDDRGGQTGGNVWSFTTREEYPGNEPPFEPSNPSPSDGACNRFIVLGLSWDGGDPNTGDKVKYDVYVGKDINLDEEDLHKENIGVDYCLLGILDLDTTYYWKVVAHDSKGETTEGDVWSFTTMEELPQNQRPNTPTITGPYEIKARTNNTYYIKSTDPEGDKIVYLVMSYFNGQPSDYTAIAGESGEEIPFTFRPTFAGDYELRACASDNPELDWSEWGCLKVTSPKNKIVKSDLLDSLLRLMDHIPILKKLISLSFLDIN